MKQGLLTILKPLRAMLMLKLRPASGYFLATRSLSPLSSKFGFDRGEPIDRYWTDSFIKQNSHWIRGEVLEVGDDHYASSQKSQITGLDILDTDQGNRRANIHGDLRNLREVVADDTYDCVILTHVLGMIDDVTSAISEIHRILKPGGVVLVASASISPTLVPEKSYWRFTEQSMKYLFSQEFKLVAVDSFGNVFAGQCFWVGMAQHELSKEELDHKDKRYQCVVTVRAVK